MRRHDRQTRLLLLHGFIWTGRGDDIYRQQVARARQPVCAPLAVGLSRITVSEIAPALEALKEAPTLLMRPKFQSSRETQAAGARRERGRENWGMSRREGSRKRGERERGAEVEERRNGPQNESSVSDSSCRPDTHHASACATQLTEDCAHVCACVRACLSVHCCCHKTGVRLCTVVAV